MAVTKRVYKLCESYFDSSKEIAELGSQFVMEEEWGNYGPPYFRDVFNHLKITTFDYYPENGATVMDLSIPIPENYKNKFEIVTNFGTSEHVQNQYNCWKNMFEMLKVGGILINEIPKKGNWEGHCKYYVDEKLLEVLEKDFEILEKKDVYYEGSGNLFFFVLKKKHDKEFQTSEFRLMEAIQIIDSYVDNQGH